MGKFFREAHPWAFKEIVLSLSLGIYFIWGCTAHYATLFGFAEKSDASLSSLTSISSALLYALIFFLTRKGFPVDFSLKNNLFFLLAGIGGIVFQHITLLQYVSFILLGLWVAWFRLALVMHLVSFPTGSIIRIVGLSFLVCGLGILGLLLLNSTIVQVIIFFIPLLLFAALAGMNKMVVPLESKRQRFVPFGSFWKIALFAFAFSMLFDVAETHLFFMSGEFMSYAIPLGFLGVFVLITSFSFMVVSGRRSFDTSVFLVAVILAFVGATSFFVSGVVSKPVAQTIIQITCGYSFVSLLIITTAEISKRYAVAPCLIFSLVFCVQRLGNFSGELIGFGFMVENPLPDAWVDAIVGISIAFCFALILFVFVTMNGRLTLFEKGLVGADTDEEREQEIEALSVVAQDKGLTEREIDVYLLLVNRYSRKEIERDLVLSVNTIKTHTSSIYRKFDVHSQVELIESAKKIYEKRYQ